MKLIKPNEVAELLNISTNTLSRWRKEGKGPPFIPLVDDSDGSSVRYDENDVLDYLESQRIDHSTSNRDAERTMEEF